MGVLDTALTVAVGANVGVVAGDVMFAVGETTVVEVSIFPAGELVHPARRMSNTKKKGRLAFVMRGF